LLLQLGQERLHRSADGRQVDAPVGFEVGLGVVQAQADEESLGLFRPAFESISHGQIVCSPNGAAGVDPSRMLALAPCAAGAALCVMRVNNSDRKSTRLNSSH